MIAEDRTVRSILSILLSGVIAISLKGAHYYALPSERLSWFVLAKRAQKLNHILLGYQQRSSLESITINPKDKDIPKYDVISVRRNSMIFFILFRTKPFLIEHSICPPIGIGPTVT